MSELFANPEPVVYQLRVVLRGVSPLIWRRLLVCGESTVADLHAVLQIAFGWSDEHLHRFVIQGRHYGDDGRADPRRVRLSDLGLRVGERWLYEYDFTDGWQHDLRLEQIVTLVPGQSYPRCTGGHRAAPPEDCGGPWGYADFLAAIRDPEHESHRELKEWVGGKFDPERFSVEAVNKSLRQLT